MNWLRRRRIYNEMLKQQAFEPCFSEGENGREYFFRQGPEDARGISVFSKSKTNRDARLIVDGEDVGGANGAWKYICYLRIMKDMPKVIAKVMTQAQARR